MGKRRRLSNKFALKKCQKGVSIAKDRISQLPDEILVYILSFLTVKEAADTSVLSRRWLSLCTCISRLDFEATKPLDEVASQSKLLHKGHMKKYMRWVNGTLQMCKGQKLDQFRIRFDLNKSAQHDIDKWLEFAFSRKVQILELDLNKCEEDIRFYYSYSFPARILDLGDSADSSTSILVKKNFKSLKGLILKSVNVTGEVLEFFLHNCPFLETMVVHGSRTLVNLEVVGPSLKLRHLEIHYCFEVESLKICDTNLITLKTSSGRELLLKNVPMLVEVDFLGTPYTHLLDDLSYRLSCVFSQLEVLTLRASLSLFDFPLEDFEHYNFPELMKLKKFVLTAFTSSCKGKHQSLLGCTSIIRAAPQLKEFELLDQSPPFTTKRKCKKATINCPLHHLKKVKLWGYYSGPFHLELLRYFLENAVALEKIIIDPTSPIYCYFPSSSNEIKRQQTARNLAKVHLQRDVPPAIDLVIL
ncbi:unnamed protein product [Withania somnifera]